MATRDLNVDSVLYVAGYGGDEYLRYVAVATEDRGEVEERYEPSVAYVISDAIDE